MKISNTILGAILKTILLTVLLEGCTSGLKVNMASDSSDETDEYMTDRELQDFVKVVERGDQALAKELLQEMKLEEKTFPEERYGSGYNIMHYAAKEGIVWLIDELLPSLDSFTSADNQGSLAPHPLHLAAQEGHLNIVKKFIENNNVNILQEDTNNATALHYAAQANQLEVFTYLWEKICERDRSYQPKQDAKGFTLLHLAMLSGHINRSKKLIEYIMKHCDVQQETIKKTFPGKESLNPSQVIKEHGDKDLKELLETLERGDDPDGGKEKASDHKNGTATPNGKNTLKRARGANASVK